MAVGLVALSVGDNSQPEMDLPHSEVQRLIGSSATSDFAAASESFGEPHHEEQSPIVDGSIPCGLWL